METSRPLPTSITSASARGEGNATTSTTPATHAGAADEHFVAPRTAVVDADKPKPPPTGGSGIFLRTKSNSGQGLSAERLVLTSSDGKPRVTLTPAEVQAAKVTAADIASVRDLPHAA